MFRFGGRGWVRCCVVVTWFRIGLGWAMCVWRVRDFRVDVEASQCVVIFLGLGYLIGASGSFVGE